ncbi:TWK-46 protein [Aphelenchoides avenae]|nr:TWK-46 protein [Aphelenchus avenae]
MQASGLQMEETNTRLATGVLVMFFYLLIGAIVFVRIEAPMERIELEAYQEFRQDWTNRLVDVGFTEHQVDRLFANIRDAALNGIWTEQNVTSESNWSFGQAFFFAGTLVSTVGYGHVSPRTPHGKLFTIVYCMIGIPLTLALLSAIALRLRQPSGWLRSKLNVRLGHLFHAKHLQIIHLMVVSAFVLVVAFIVPSMIFVSIEQDWSYIDAFYYCFVSLTTIGLGDYVPGDKPEQPYRGFYKFIVTVYLLIGLSCMMILLATLYDVPQFNLVRFFVTQSNEEESEGKPIHMNNGGPKYQRYDEETLSPTGSGTTSSLPYAVTNNFYQ